MNDNESVPHPMEAYFPAIMLGAALLILLVGYVVGQVFSAIFYEMWGPTYTLIEHDVRPITVRTDLFAYAIVGFGTLTGTSLAVMPLVNNE